MFFRIKVPLELKVLRSAFYIQPSSIRGAIKTLSVKVSKQL